MDLTAQLYTTASEAAASASSRRSYAKASESQSLHWSHLLALALVARFITLEMSPVRSVVHTDVWHSGWPVTILQSSCSSARKTMSARLPDGGLPRAAADRRAASWHRPAVAASHRAR
jgi:hypothetical protein